MSTGIGNHKIVDGTGNHIYSAPKVYCPYCNEICEADFVDVGAGLVQCGPYHCVCCEASEISSLDTRELSKDEKETGWYEPFTPPSENANTWCGVLVDHKPALLLYKNGTLDK